jgi:hypothetical protein
MLMPLQLSKQIRAGRRYNLMIDYMKEREVGFPLYIFQTLTLSISHRFLPTNPEEL